MRSKEITKAFYCQKLGFRHLGEDHFDEYLMLVNDQIEIHFFSFQDLDPSQNSGQVYIRTTQIGQLYQSYLDNQVAIHPNGNLSAKPWGQTEFSILDPDNNLLTFGQSTL